MDEIVASAQRFNEPRGITGRLLVVTDQSDNLLAFMQWIEGPLLPIQACLGRIVADTRHTTINVVRNQPARERSYPEWSMYREVIPVEQVESALAAAGITGRIEEGEGVIVVEGEIVQSVSPEDVEGL